MNLFISFEGPDGSGKTTLTQRLYQAFLDEGRDVLLTREPGGIELSEKIRDIILDPANHTMDKRTEALLYAASRRQHLIEKIVPALEEGKLVLCDRFVDSSLAYQGYARGIGIDEVYKINAFAIESYLPDLTFFLDIDPELGLKRIASRQKLDRLEQETLAFHQEVYQGYQEVIRRFPERIKLIDASRDEETVFNEVFGLIKEVL